MATTWFQFRQDTKSLICDVTANNDLFASACAAYVKSMIAREVDHDLLSSKSYWNYFEAMRRRLLGFQTTLIPGSTLDTAVRILLPVDDQREGIQNYLTQQIKNAFQELASLDTFVTKLMREAIIDMQSYIPCYRVGVETSYGANDMVIVGNMSRCKMPDQAELREGFFLLAIQALTINTQYAAGDYVSSNGRTYMVVKDGSLTSLGSGLLTTDGSVEVLNGMSFIFYYGEACLRSELVVLPWKDRFQSTWLRDGCRGDRSRPAVIFIDPEAYSFYVWPKLDATHTVALNWTSLKFTFADGDTVPFDETAQEAVREFVLAKYFMQVEKEPSSAKMHEGAYLAIRSRAYVDCKNRQFMEYP